MPPYSHAAAAMTGESGKFSTGPAADGEGERRKEKAKSQGGGHVHRLPDGQKKNGFPDPNRAEDGRLGNMLTKSDAFIQQISNGIFFFFF